MNKIIELLKSRRFWLLTVAALSAIGSQWVAGTLTLELSLNIVSGWLLAVVGVGTVDKLGTK